MRVERIGEATLYTADVLEALRSMADESVHCVMTSPPYWGLRDYGAAGQLGLEKTPEEYVTSMVLVFREVRRVLRADGTCWVNLGDSYNAMQGKGWRPDASSGQRIMPATGTEKRQVPDGLKPKDLVGIPWRVAFALQADGWYLRSDIIWAKPNPMPESVTDRPTKAHEYLFLLSKSGRYYYDAEAIKEPCESGPSDLRKMEEGLDRIGGKHKVLVDPLAAASSATHIGQKRSVGDPAGRNRRTVWTIATQPFPEAHFATFPEKLVEPCILAGCPAQTCPECGAPWVRVVEKVGERPSHSGSAKPSALMLERRGAKSLETSVFADGMLSVYKTTGFRPTCAHDQPPVPGTFLDPFCGAGTALLVALRLARRAVGIELKPEYMEMTRKRIEAEAAQVKLCL